MTDDYQRADEAAQAAVKWTLARCETSVSEAKLWRVAQAAARSEADLAVEFSVAKDLPLGPNKGQWWYGVVIVYYLAAVMWMRRVHDVYPPWEPQSHPPQKQVDEQEPVLVKGREVSPVEGILNALDDGPLNKSELVARADLTPEEWQEYIPALREEGVIVTIGKGRGTKYCIIENGES